MAASYTEYMFRKLANMPWVKEPEARAFGYHLRAKKFKPTPQNILSFTLETMELFQFEQTRIARNALATSLDKVLSNFQRSYSTFPLTPIYLCLMITADDTNYARTLGSVGLNTAQRERNPTSHAFFEWFVQRLARGARPFFDDEKHIANFLPMIEKTGRLAKKHRSLITPAYVETVCSLLNLPLEILPRATKFEAPHKRSERQRITGELREDNKAIRFIHAYSIRNLAFVLDAVKKKIIKYSAHELFLPQALRILEKAAIQHRMTRIAGHAVPILLYEINTQIVTEHAKHHPHMNIQANSNALVKHKQFIRYTPKAKMLADFAESKKAATTASPQTAPVNRNSRAHNQKRIGDNAPSETRRKKPSSPFQQRLEKARAQNSGASTEQRRPLRTRSLFSRPAHQ